MVHRVMMVVTVCGCLVAMGPASGQVFWPGGVVPVAVPAPVLVARPIVVARPVVVAQPVVVAEPVCVETVAYAAPVPAAVVAPTPHAYKHAYRATRRAVRRGW
jgi:hypothetical protein